jgi:glyoxylase-like metal-dependent hydrolase (beta-lactamase superfamily II)
MKPLSLGEIEVRKVVELDRLALAPNWLIANSNREEIEAERAWLGDELVERDTGKLLIGVHSFLIRTPRLTILVDTCCGNDRERGTESPFHRLQTGYLQNLRAAGVEPEQIDLVFCTHLHVDHVGWNVMQKDGRFVPTFANARYLFCEEDFEHRLEAQRNGTGSPATRAAFLECVVPIVEAGRATFFRCDEVVDHDLDTSIRVTSLPGHCPGHSGLAIAGGGRSALVTGDAIHHPIQLGRPHWYCSADVDPEVSSATRADLVERYADTDTVLLTAHFRGPTAGRIVSHPRGARFDFL